MFDIERMAGEGTRSVPSELLSASKNATSTKSLGRTGVAALGNILAGGVAPKTKMKNKNKKKREAKTERRASIKDFGHKSASESKAKRRQSDDHRHRSAFYNHYGETLQEYVMGSEDAAKEDGSELLIHCRHGASGDF